MVKDRNVNVDGAPMVSLSYTNGRFFAKVEFERELRGGNTEWNTIWFADLKPHHLRCLARGIHRVLDSVESDIEETRQVMRYGDDA